uniref:Ig-like and fibronectin type-III domain-containing protein C25G4.10 n=1 Tax=Magallana gigas TaxID=29159 RepID=A0A8W8KXC1_MAGGI|nr:Ig-like and fibronectin type-III domain-containing protein 1 isoform X2 [Crassostrea gigas]XP_011432115.2 Ig-like and fibronectin type-III domain-containing protein 1 isoform X2 [Crassostrea gigas]XP_034314784.1 Ig-like and fibronectin type-III domain-containing protein 1 isoform X2 [Crassostrea gigas]
MTSFKAVLSVITAAHLLYMVSAELKMLSDNGSYTVNPDHTVVLPCVVQDQGAKKAIWKNLKDGSKISVNFEILSQEKNKYTIERPQDNTHFTWNLRINNVVDGDQGYYQCYIQENPNISVIHYVIVEGADEVPTHTNGSANLNVTSCCIDANVSSSCLPVCHLSSMPTDLNVLTACASDINKVLKCGTDGMNHVGCCKRRGVDDICLDFCYGAVPSNLDTQHLSCLSQLPTLLTCLEEGKMLLPGPPVAVSVVQSVSDDQKSLLVTWRPPTQNPDLVTGYKVLFKLTSETHYKSTRIIGTSELMFKLGSLQLEVEYSVRVVSLGLHGSSQPSETFLVTLLQTQPKSEVEADILDCCSKKGVSDPCISKLCKPDLLTNVPPVEILRCDADFDKVQQCLVGQRDHTPCCKRNSLPDVCLPLCAGQIMNNSVDYISCVIRMPIINACIQEGRAAIPGPPINITVLPGVREAVISWDNNGANATMYTLLYKQKQMNTSSWSHMAASSSPLLLRGLYPGTLYEFKMAAANELGSSLLSSSVVFLTYENVITTPAPTQPSGLHNLTACCSEKNVKSECRRLCSFDVLGAGSLDFSIALSCMDQLALIISCASDGRDHTMCCKESLVPSACDNICQFSQHDELTADFITCVSYTGIIANCYREGLATLPRQPQNFRVLKYTSHAVYLAWQQPKATSTQIESYSVIYSSSNQTDQKTVSTKNLELIVNNLNPNTNYIFKVVSVNENGTSAPTPEVHILTKAFDDGTQQKKCNFTVKNDTNVKTKDNFQPRVFYGTQEECQKYCDIPLCIGYTYSRQDKACALYMNKASLVPFPQPGIDFYNHTCPTPPNIIPPGNWSLQFHNRTDCCQKINVTDSCMEACVTGNFQSVYQCEADYSKILTCASDGRDHTSCCQNLQVPENCLGFCKGHLVPTTGIQALCLNYIPRYVQCFVNGTMYLPTPPESVMVKVVNGTTVLLTWEPPTSNCDVLTGCHYVVSLWNFEKNMTRNKTRETKFLLTGLKSQAVYFVAVMAVNKYGKSISSGEMKFVTPPLVADVDISVSQTPSYPPSQHGEVELFCNVYSAERTFPFVYWIRNNKIIRKGRQLKMSGLSERDEGNYTCSAKDDRGIVSNITHFLRIMYKPKAYNLSDESYLADQRQVATLQCDFKGFPKSVKWFKGREEIPVTEFKESFHTESSLITFPTLRRSVLTIYYVVDAAFDRYTCVGYNDFGNGSGIVQLRNGRLTPPPTVVPTVPAVRNVSACCMSYDMPKDCLELCSFTVDTEKAFAQTDKYGHCLAYLQFYTACASDGKDHSECCEKKGVHSFCSSSFCAGFIPDDMGSIFLMNCVTDTKLILECVQENQEFIPSAPALTAVLNNDVIQVSWDKPEDNPHRVDHYELYWQGSDSPSTPEQVSVVSSLTNHQIKNIKEGVNYTIWIIASNEKGSSQPVNKKWVLVKNLKPSKPTNLHVSEVNGESVVLKWDPPENHAVVTNYTIMYRKAASKGSYSQLTVPGSVQMYLVRNLQPNTLYEFQIVANGPFGKSKSAALGSALNSGPSTSANKSKGPERSAVPLGIGLTVAVLLIAGAIVALYLYMRRRKKMNYGETVSFENPQYGSRVQISGLPHANDSSDEGFGYAPLREDHDIEHRHTDKSNLRDEATMDVTMS